MARNDMIAGLLEAAETLLVHNGAPVAEVAEMLGKTPAQLETLLETLSICGVPPYDPGTLIDAYIEDGRVYIKNLDIFIKAARKLDRDEAAALLIGHDIAMSPPFASDAELLSAFKKIRAAIVGSLSQELQALGDRVATETTGGKLSQTLSLLRASCCTKKIEIEYLTPGKPTSTRVIRPYSLTFRRNHWYCIAWCESRNEVRSFRADRISSARLNGETFTPSADIIKEAGEPTWNISSPVLIEARLAFASGAPAAMAGEMWTEKITRNADGSAEVRFQMFDPAKSVSFVLSLGEGVTVVSPPALRELVAAEAEAALKLYDTV